MILKIAPFPILSFEIITEVEIDRTTIVYNIQNVKKCVQTWYFHLSIDPQEDNRLNPLKISTASWYDRCINFKVSEICSRRGFGKIGAARERRKFWENRWPPYEHRIFLIVVPSIWKRTIGQRKNGEWTWKMKMDAFFREHQGCILDLEHIDETRVLIRRDFLFSGPRTSLLEFHKRGDRANNCRFLLFFSSLDVWWNDDR